VAGRPPGARRGKAGTLSRCRAPAKEDTTIAIVVARPICDLTIHGIGCSSRAEIT